MINQIHRILLMNKPSRTKNGKIKKHLINLMTLNYQLSIKITVIIAYKLVKLKQLLNGTLNLSIWFQLILLSFVIDLWLIRNSTNLVKCMTTVYKQLNQMINISKHTLKMAKHAQNLEKIQGMITLILQIKELKD